jgi:hypothetical protein
MDKLKEKLQGMTSGELWEILIGLIGSLDDASCMVYELAIDAFESKVSDDVFVDRLNKLDAMEVSNG